MLTLFQVNEQYPLVVAVNRDELRTRPSRPPFRWSGEPRLWAGRDEVAGGTWLAVNAHGLLAAVTNRRDGDTVDLTLPSRGQLLLGVARQPSAEAARAFLAAELAARRYNPFNLLCASPHDGWLSNWRGDTSPLTPGPHVLTHRGAVDDRTLPTIQRAWEHLARLDLANLALKTLLPALGEICADTAGDDPICRVGGQYGTVSSSMIALRPDGTIAAYWHAPGPPSEFAYAPVLLT